MSYIDDFLQRNKKKPFVNNLKKYLSLNEFGRLKCVLSFMCHIVVDAEHKINNTAIQEELLSIITKMVLYKEDVFLDWLQEKIK